MGADPIQKLLCGRDPVRALADTVIERHRRRLKRKAKRSYPLDLKALDGRGKALAPPLFVWVLIRSPRS
ncbi:MAG: hypothetical protein ACREV7_07685 [Steroidobacteraceae bacterium]